MRNAFILLLLMGICSLSFGQRSQIGDTRWSFGMSYDLIDQYTPDMDGFQTFKVPMDYGLRTFFWLNLSSSIAIEFGAGTNGMRFQSIPSGVEEKNLHVMNADAGVVYKFNNGYIFKESATIAPFLFAKARGSYINELQVGESGSSIGLGIPLGGGINWKVGDNMAIQTAAGYTVGVTDNYNNNIFFSVGLMMDLGKEKKIEVIEEPEPEDTDGDGIIDDNDECPEDSGLVEFNGCPDTDGDGIMDLEDDCPEEPGLEEFRGCPDTDGDGIPDPLDDCPDQAGSEERNGCPDPDDDGDGVPDSEDKCPGVPGLPELSGCPDTDGDGVTDASDKCPTEPGPASNQGCPELEEEVVETLEYAAENIEFYFGRAELKETSFPVLDEIIKILNEWPNYSVEVTGHADSTGPTEFNQTLSEDRAKAAADYFTSKGVDASRVVVTGYGEGKPIESNDTTEGRAKNRRVEFNLFLP